MPAYKLYYFPGRGRAEGSRLMFAYAGIDYEDIRLSGDKWQEFKPKTPNGQMPVLEVDGKLYSQSAAIEEYVAEVTGLNGKSAMDRFLINILRDDILDWAKPWPIGEKDEEIKKKKEDEILDEGLPLLLQKIEDGLKTRKRADGFFLDEISRGDITVIQLYEFVIAKRPNVFEKYENIKKIIDQTLNEKNIKAWIDKRPESTF